MFVIAGATGNIGAEILRLLAAQGRNLRAIARDPTRITVPGVETVALDLTDEAALTAALRGATAAWALVPPAPQHPDPVAQAIAVVTSLRAAARAAGLPKLVFLSSEAAHLAQGNGPIRQLHVAEAILADAAPEVTFLRPGFFQENWKGMLAVAATQGVLPSMIGPGRRSMVATRDIAAAAASLLLEPGAPRLVELASAQLYTAEDAAAAAAAALGKPVQLVVPPREAWQGILEGAGFGPAYAAQLVEMNEGIASGVVDFEGSGRQVTGPTTLQESFRAWV